MKFQKYYWDSVTCMNSNGLILNCVVRGFGFLSPRDACRVSVLTYVSRI